MYFQNLYILNSKGKFLYTHKNSQERDHDKSLNVLSTLERLANELGGNMRAAEIGGHKYYETSDALTGFQLILKVEKDVRDGFINRFLKSIKEIFLTLSTKHHVLKDEKNAKMWKAFREKVNQLIEESTNDQVDDFLSLV